MVIGSSLRLGDLTPTNLESLDRSRKAVEKFNGSYEKLVAEKWNVSEKHFGATNGGTVRVIVHQPKSAEKDQGSVPLVLWGHGGGMILGSCKDSWSASFMLAVQAKWGSFCWASVEYRLAPEHKFPDAVDDFETAFRSLSDETLAKELGYSTSNIILGGVSAGAFVAAHLLLRLAPTRPAALPAVALLYPMVDPNANSESHELYGSLPSCPSSFLRVSWGWLLSDGDGKLREDLVKAANLLEQDLSILRGAKVFVCTASFDALRDEGVALAKKLREAGAEVSAVEGAGSHCMPHMLNPQCKAQTFDALARLLDR